MCFICEFGYYSQVNLREQNPEEVGILLAIISTSKPIPPLALELFSLGFLLLLKTSYVIQLLELRNWLILGLHVHSQSLLD